MFKVAILTVPFISCDFHFEHLVNTYQSFVHSSGDFTFSVHAVINRCDQPNHLEFIKSCCDSVEHNRINNLALAWNIGIKKLLDQGNDYVLVTNLDIVIHPLLIQNLTKAAESNPEAVMWCAHEVSDLASLLKEDDNNQVNPGANFSCFMVNRRLFEAVGEFDTQFEPAYHEDSDMAYRVALSDQTILSVPNAKFLHIGQGTLKSIILSKDEKLAMDIRLSMNLSMERYANKWGGLPGKEVFKTPYNS